MVLVLEYALILLVLAFFLDQVLFPLAMGMPIFPRFRRGSQEKALKEEIQNLRQKLHEQNLERDAERLKKELEKK